MSCDKNNITKDGIKFEKDNWENTLAKAKVENKIVFVDAYTTWCGPCKKMDAKTFPDNTQISFAFIKNGKVNYYGIKKEKKVTKI